MHALRVLFSNRKCSMAAGSEGKGHGRMLSEVRSDLADQGSIISDRDEPQRTVPVSASSTAHACI